jgi:hypothetical protein
MFPIIDGTVKEEELSFSIQDEPVEDEELSWQNYVDVPKYVPLYMELCKGGTAPRVQLKYLSMFHSR